MPDYGSAPTPPPKRLWPLLAVVAVLIIVLAVIGFVVLHKSDKKGDAASDQAKTATFKNQLTPASEIRVGNFRYVSPCQALPLSAIKSIFNSVDGDTNVTEDALTVSVPPATDALPAETRCDYSLAGGDVTLYADQYLSKDDLSSPEFVMVADATDIQNFITSTRKTAGNNADAKALVAAMQKGLATFKKAESASESGADTIPSTNGVIAPDSASDGRVNFMYGNVKYGIEIASSDGDSQKLSAAQLGQVYKAMQIVMKNAADKHLDQSPINTILGSSDKVSGIKVLEPCTLIDAATFQAATGRPENSPMERTTLPVNINKIRYSAKHTENPGENSCTRNYDVTDDESVDSSSFELDLYYPRSVDLAKQFVQDYLKSDPNDISTPLQTGADEAYSTPSVLDPTVSLYLFRVGPYIGELSISNSTSAGFEDSIHDTQATQAQYVQAINAIAAGIKQQQ